jgi:molecular chaperone GrpE
VSSEEHNEEQEAVGQDPTAEAGSVEAEQVAESQEESVAAAEVEQDLEQLQDPAVEAQAMRELAQRTQADFENFRKRARQAEQQAGERGIAKLAGELVGALDNFEHALAATAERSDAEQFADVARGFELIRDELVAGFSRVGIEVDRPAEGDKFDPQVHEAIAHVPAPDTEPGTIVGVHQAGYRIGSTVIRPARVAVAGA